VTAVTTAALRVVPVAEANLELVAGVVNRAFGRYEDLYKGQRTSPEYYLDEVGPLARVMLVEGDDKLLATAMVTDATGFFDYGEGELAEGRHPWAGTLYFGLAGVEPTLMNGGYGRMMVGHALELARAEGFRGVSLGTVREFGLVEYYEKLGFRVIHEEKFPAGHWEFVVEHQYCEMVKHL